MKKWKNGLLGVLVGMLFLMLCPATIHAENIYKKVTITVLQAEGVSERAGNLQLIADEDISSHYTKGTDMNIHFKENETGDGFFVNTYIPVGYHYILRGGSSTADVDLTSYDNSQMEVEVQVTLKKDSVRASEVLFSEETAKKESTGTQAETVGTVDPANDKKQDAVKLSHDASASAAATGDTVSYTLKELYNQSGEIADNFSFHVTLPAGSCLTSIYTGTYTEDATLAFIYKTKNHAEWKIGNENISALKAETIQAQDLSLEEGDYITEFTFSAESVPSGFAMKQDDPLKYNVKVLSSEEGKTLNIQTALSSYVQKEKSYTSNGTSTTVINGVQTGDGNVLMVVSLVGLIVSVIGLIGYVVYIIISKTPKKRESISFQKRQSKDISGKSLKDFL